MGRGECMCLFLMIGRELTSFRQVRSCLVTNATHWYVYKEIIKTGTQHCLPVIKDAIVYAAWCK